MEEAGVELLVEVGNVALIGHRMSTVLMVQHSGRGTYTLAAERGVASAFHLEGIPFLCGLVSV